MFPFLHLIVPALIFEIPQLRERLKWERFYVLLGALLPDIIDKPLLVFFQISGRGFAHTPFYMAILMILLLFITRRRNIVGALSFGILCHLLLDIPYIPWLAPFVEYDFGYLEDPLAGWWYTLTHNRLIQITEIISLVSFGLIAIRYHLIFDKHRIYSFLLDKRALLVGVIIKT